VNGELRIIWTEMSVIDLMIRYYPSMHLEGVRYMNLLLIFVVHTYLDEEGYA
jgi:hypothetical protein